MFPVPQQVSRNRRRMAALTTLQNRIANRKPNAKDIAIVKEQTEKLRQFFNELAAEEDRIQREIWKVGEKIHKLEQNAEIERGTCENKPK
ncbi:uncharacterized protein [Eurosta solidaginis]|uniref:uncharacterized protein n=1 Tax=Eurosta solidaginis TaxID=178769 RepID=UPI00353085E3